MRHFRPKRPSAGVVIGLLALFVALGGTVYAASKISGSSIKKNSIPGNRLKKNTLTGAQINLAKLGTVPSATTASTATSATSAGSINGVSLKKFDVRGNANTAETTAYDDGHIRVTFTCDGTGAIAVKAYTATDHAELQSYGDNSDTRNDDFSVAANPLTLSSTSEQRDVLFTDAGGHTVHLSYVAAGKRLSGSTCILSGFAEAG